MRSAAISGSTTPARGCCASTIRGISSIGSSQPTQRSEQEDRVNLRRRELMDIATCCSSATPYLSAHSFRSKKDIDALWIQTSENKEGCGSTMSRSAAGVGMCTPLIANATRQPLPAGHRFAEAARRGARGLRVDAGPLGTDQDRGFAWDSACRPLPRVIRSAPATMPFRPALRAPFWNHLAGFAEL
jgi:hypothetical protein